MYFALALALLRSIRLTSRFSLIHAHARKKNPNNKYLFIEDVPLRLI